MAKKIAKKKKPLKARTIKLVPPLSDKAVAALKAGDRVLICGKIYAARDSAHKIFGKQPPFEPEGAILYYASPTPARKGFAIGSIGPTTATRMDPFTPDLLKVGVKITIGKGRRSDAVKKAMKKHNAAYLVVPGGAAAALSKHVRRSTVLAYPDLGPEAVLELDVMNFPAIVAIDSKGNDLFEEGRKTYEK
ncbi:MAG: fumarate hydratase C-terminal domain-containing protein [Candidatus Saganbacteria bacterium]|nr:fumarate hydratase C-terminal domain-containing protein [Candidatus Saganbacteria bacterium]